MARRNDYGRFIISAGEVGSYVVCPEAWRLSQVEKVRSVPSQTMRDGNTLHKEWDKQIQQVRYFARSIKVTLWLLAISAVFFFVKFLLLKPLVSGF